MKWITFDGYREEHQLVDKSGRILGTVTGSDFERSEGWWATGEMQTPAAPLGRYATKEQAKSAVEAYTATDAARKEKT